MSSISSGGDPVAVIRRFVGHPDLPLVEEGGRWHLPLPPEDPLVTPCPWGYFSLDEEGRVVDADLSPGLVPLVDQAPSGAVWVDRTQALRIVRPFLAAQVDGFARLELVEAKSEDRGQEPNGRPYRHHQFEWRERLGSQGALGITRVNASVDTTGSLVSFVQIPPTPITVDVEPTIAREAALARARARYGKPITASGAELDVWWAEDGSPGAQVLRWIVDLTGTEPWHSGGSTLKGAGYAFDAYTGRLLWEYVAP